MTEKSRTLAVPLFFYLAVTLGVPVVRGAGARPGFWFHAATLLVAAAAVSAAWAYSSRFPFRVRSQATPRGRP